MAVEFFRIDDRRIHGQVVVGWGQPLDLKVIVLVDDDVAGSDWEQELYRMGVPPGMDVYFESVATTPDRLTQLAGDPRHGMLLTSDIETMRQLAVQVPSVIHAIHIGGIHHRPGRTQRLRYVFLDSSEEDALRALAGRGITVTAQDVPGARPIALDELLAAHGAVNR